MTTKIIGIDTKSTGIHWVATQRILDLYDNPHPYGWCSCDDSNPDVRRIKIFKYALALFESLPEQMSVFCEEPLALQNGKTTRLLGLAAGAIWAAHVASNHDGTWYWVDQSSWKKTVLGRGIRPKDWGLDLPKGRREKDWIRSVVRELPGFRLDFFSAVADEDFDSQPDLYDALAIRTYGVRMLGRYS